MVDLLAIKFQLLRKNVNDMSSSTYITQQTCIIPYHTVSFLGPAMLRTGLQSHFTGIQ